MSGRQKPMFSAEFIRLTLKEIMRKFLNNEEVNAPAEAISIITGLTPNILWDYKFINAKNYNEVA